NGTHLHVRPPAPPRLAGKVHFANPVGPGWANPKTGRFDDPRLRGRDGKPYGPLPRSGARYRGLYHFGNQVIVSYTVGRAEILEMPTHEVMRPARGSSGGGRVAFARRLNIGKSPHDLLMRVAPRGPAVALIGKGKAGLVEKNGFTLLRVPAAATPVALKVLVADARPEELRAHVR